MTSKLKLSLHRFLIAAAAAAPIVAPGVASAAQSAAAVREIEVVVDGGTYAPRKITATKGERIRLKFVRREYNACTKELLIPSLGIRRELPPQKPVVIELPALEPGEHEFRCGMNMARGTIVVTAAS